MFNNEMFKSIKTALQKPQETSNLKDVLKLEPDAKYYVVRLIPNIKEPAKTFFHYYSHGWKSLATGQFVGAISPTTWGERDPIAEARFQIYKNGSEEEKEKSKLLNRRENWMVNVFVVSDPKHPENNGKVKIFRFGRKIKVKIDAAIEGEDAEEFGSKIFDLSATGCNFKIKSVQQGDFYNYDESKFASASEIPGMTPEKMKEVYNGIFDLEKVQTVKSFDELQTMVDEHYFNVKPVKGKKAESTKKEKVETKDEHGEDEIPMTTPPTPVETKESAGDTTTDEVLSDDKIKELLAGLDKQETTE